MRSRYLNLKDGKNPDLRFTVLRGVISAKESAVMDADQMASEDLKRKRIEITQQMILEHYKGEKSEGVASKDYDQWQ